jgi:hypothetical protein
MAYANSAKRARTTEMLNGPHENDWIGRGCSIAAFLLLGLLIAIIYRAGQGYYN